MQKAINVVWQPEVIPVSSLVPYRIIKTLASVPAYFLQPVFILIVYVVDMAAMEINQNKLKHLFITITIYLIKIA